MTQLSGITMFCNGVLGGYVGITASTYVFDIAYPSIKEDYNLKAVYQRVVTKVTKQKE